MNSIKILVFDLDDTLFPEREFVFSGFRAVGDWMFSQYAIPDFFEVAWKLFNQGKRGLIFNQALEQIGIEPKPDLIQQLIQVYRRHKPTIFLHEDAEWALNYFKSQKQLGLITNGFLETQQNKVRALGIESRFNQIVYCDSYGFENWKPSLIPYQKMMEITGFESQEYVYVGDHPHKDFIAAKKLGWTTVRICRDGGEYSTMAAEESHEADLKITSLYELKNIN